MYLHNTRGVVAIQIAGLPITRKGQALSEYRLWPFRKDPRERRSLCWTLLMRSKYNAGARRTSTFSSRDNVLLDLMKTLRLIIGKMTCSWCESMCPYLMPLINCWACGALRRVCSLLCGGNVSSAAAAAEEEEEDDSECVWARLHRVVSRWMCVCSCVEQVVKGLPSPCWKCFSEVNCLEAELRLKKSLTEAQRPQLSRTDAVQMQTTPNCIKTVTKLIKILI